MQKLTNIAHFKVLIIGCLFISFTAFQCKLISNSEKTVTKTDSTAIELKELAKQNYGSEYTILHNRTKTFAVCRKGEKKQPMLLNSYCDFFIYDILNNSVTSKNKILQATVQWENDTLLRITKFKHGRMEEPPQDNKLIYYHNVLNNKKIKSYKQK